MRTWLASMAIIAMLALTGLLIIRVDHSTPRQAQTASAEATPSSDSHRACEDETIHALTRTAMGLDAGVSVDQVVAQERQLLSPRVYAAYSFVLNDFIVQRSRQEGVANQITAVMPGVRQIC